MELTTAKLQQIIKEELNNLLAERNFDSDTGLPLNARAMKLFIDNQKERFNAEVKPVVLELINNIAEDYGPVVKQMVVFGINKSSNQAAAFYELFKVAQHLGIKTPEAQPKPDGDKIASDALASAKSSVAKNMSPEERQQTIKRFDELIKQAEEAGDQAEVAKLRRKKEFYN